MLIDWCRNGMIESPEEVSKKIAAYSKTLYGPLFEKQ